MPVGELIFSGLSDAGRSIAGGIEQRKRRDQEASALRRYLKVIEPEGSFDALGLEDLQGEIQGRTLQQAMQEQQQRKRESDARLQLLQQQHTGGAALEQALAGIRPGLAAGTLAEGQGPVNPPQAGEEDVLQAMLRDPRSLNAPNAPNALALGRYLREAQEMGAGAHGVDFIESPTGAQIAFSRRTGAFQYDPFSKTEAEAGKARFSVEPIIGRYTGEVEGYGVKAQFANEAEAREWADKQNALTGGKAAAKPLDAETAKKLLKEAGGDKEKARELARKRGYTF